jgi:ATP-dependent DNA ligase
MAFDVLFLTGVICATLLLRIPPPTIDARVRSLDHIVGRGVDFFAAACRLDLEGIVAKWSNGTYQSGPYTSWRRFGIPSIRSGTVDAIYLRRDETMRRNACAG